MSEPLSAVFEPLRDTPPPAPFAEPETVRRRGRTRARRRAVGTAAALALGVAVVSVPVASHYSRPGRTVTFASGDPGRTVLAPADLGPGSWIPGTRVVYGAGQLWYWATLCGDPGAPTLARQYIAESTTFHDGPREVTQTVERYAPAAAADNLADVRATVAACRDSVRLSVVGDRFAGEESLLVRVDESRGAGDRPVSRYVGVARVRDLVTTVAPVGMDAEQTKTLTRLAADRLR